MRLGSGTDAIAGFAAGKARQHCGSGVRLAANALEAKTRAVRDGSPLAISSTRTLGIHRLFGNRPGRLACVRDQRLLCSG